MSASRRWPPVRQAVKALQDLGMHRKVQLIVSGGIRNGADVAKALGARRRCGRHRHRGAGGARRQRPALRRRVRGARHPRRRL